MVTVLGADMVVIRRGNSGLDESERIFHVTNSRSIVASQKGMNTIVVEHSGFLQERCHGAVGGAIEIVMGCLFCLVAFESIN